MEFYCTNCGRKLTVPDSQAGRKGRCPQCKEVLIVPDPPRKPPRALHDKQLLDLSALAEGKQIPNPVSTRAANDRDANVRPKPEPRDELLLDEPPPSDEPSDVGIDELRRTLGGRFLEPEPIPERKYPWLVDIFLYPLNISALLILLICVGGPFLLRVMVFFSIVCTIHIPVLVILWLISLVAHWVLFLLLVMYMIWYVFACIRDSAEGGIRAANTSASTPGLGELFWETTRLGLCTLFCLTPVIVYVIRSNQSEALYWGLFGMGGFALPMAILSVIMHDSLGGLNPFLLLRSIARTLHYYILLVPFCYVVCLTFPPAFSMIFSKDQWHLGYPLLAMAFYLLLIMAHLLGRFYFKNEERLYWDA